MCQGIKVSMESGEKATKTKGSHEVAKKQTKENPLVIAPAVKAAAKGLSVPGMG